MGFDAFIREIEARRWPVHGAELYEDGVLRRSYGVTEERRFPIYSAAKTITALAVGMAAEEGKLELDRSILDYLPGDAAGGLPPEQTAAFRFVTVRRLLTMSVAGFPFRPSGESWLRNALLCPLARPETARFEYSNVSAYLAGAAAANALGEDLYQYLQRRLFQPLDIPDPPCQRCPEGYFYGATGMALTVRELSKIGLLLLRRGVCSKGRLVSEDFVRAAVSPWQGSREDGYGYFIWTRPNGFYISGKWGQKCFVFPEQGQMVTFLADMEHGAEALTDSMERHLIPPRS